MAELAENLIRKKIQNVRAANTPIARFQDVLSGMVKRIEQDLRDYLGSVVEAMIMDAESKKFSDVLDAISMPAMIGVIEVDGVERSAMLNLDLDLVYHIVDLRMGGLPSELPEFAARRPTGIDNNMCAPVVDLVADSFSSALSTALGWSEKADMRCSNFEHLPMLANIALEQADVLCVQVSVDVGEAARSGNFELVLPFSTIDMISARLRKTAKPPSSGANDAWAAHMLDVVLDSEIELYTALHTAHHSVAEMSRLQVGDVLELDVGSHQAIKLQVNMGDELISIANARLGAFKRAKALKLTTDPDPEFLSPLQRMREQ